MKKQIVIILKDGIEVRGLHYEVYGKSIQMYPGSDETTEQDYDELNKLRSLLSKYDLTWNDVVRWYPVRED